MKARGRIEKVERRGHWRSRSVEELSDAELNERISEQVGGTPPFSDDELRAIVQGSTTARHK